MPERLTVIATWGRAVAKALESYDCDSEALFQEFGLDSRLSYDPNAHYPIDKISALLKKAVELTGDDAFGLKVSRHLPNTYLPALGVLVSASENMLKGFESLCRFFHAVNDVAELELREEQDGVFLEYRLVNDIEKLLPVEMEHLIPAEVVDATFAGLVDSVRSNLDPGFRVRRVHFGRSRPQNEDAFDRLFQAPILYSQVSDKLEFDYEVLTRPLPICDIAHLLGFNDQSNFSKAFKRWQSCSPAAYRKQ